MAFISSDISQGVRFRSESAQVLGIAHHQLYTHPRRTLLDAQSVELVPAEPNKQHASGVGNVLWISDIHIDPYYGDIGTVPNCTHDTKYGGKGCDTPWRLFTSLVESASENVPQPDFILTTGDYIRHWPEVMPDPENEEYEVLSRIVTTLENTFPNAHKVYPYQLLEWNPKP
ncbi:hypothetical protein SARC_13463 [Sphaeroforma arctica JP610]|uniref:Uncharacterized protein n=1 Tax=Sphaeroforma arctica JP610 TaxID=667725 RepID=A0A0L0FB65_9EUKA|nr:hypothetical protein SARC_13463 [Sphaeroforma arctica JP610]KNC73979.1 hypothetical protein SARC_13463 [Sphaeroforma arctica JP610]|eukprot:XP_014147881.1 hypothetical protein SARC_13463 [Sphaeroforma arctica JP610]